MNGAPVIGFSGISCLKAPEERKIIAAKLSASAPGRLSSELDPPFLMRASITAVAAPGLLLRRSLLGFVLIAAAVLNTPALADTAPADATATIEHFNKALLAAMKTGEQTDFRHRFQALAPEVDQAFDLPAVLVVSVGPDWAIFSPDQQSRLLDAFRRYTVASYLANFSSYAGQSFTSRPIHAALAQVGWWCRAASCRSGATQLSLTM
jgi:hypothetical protein